MRNLFVWLLLLMIVGAFLFNLLGLMHLAPLFVTSPLLFFTLLLFFLYLNDRNRFKGF